jgi:hypothetical protein
MPPVMTRVALNMPVVMSVMSGRRVIMTWLSVAMTAKTIGIITVAGITMMAGKRVVITQITV